MVPKVGRPQRLLWFRRIVTCMETWREGLLFSPNTVVPLDKAHTFWFSPNRFQSRLAGTAASGDTKPIPPVAEFHQPVFVEEIRSRFNLQNSPRLLDCTVGDGGHTIQFLQVADAAGQVLALDRDKEALQRTRHRLQALQLQEQVKLVHADFGQLQDIACAYDFAPVDNILLDLGYSSHQIDTADRGFSLRRDGPLDMRMDQTQFRTAGDIVNTWPEAELSDLLFSVGEERHARRVAQAIVASRPIGSTARLAEVVRNVIPQRGYARIHPATKTFQALRIEVNDELEQLQKVLPQALNLLTPGGRLFIVAFHSLEDRLVKRFFQSNSRRIAVNKYAKTDQQALPVPQIALLTRGALRPNPREKAANPRSRSARLRVAEKSRK